MKKKEHKQFYFILILVSAIIIVAGSIFIYNTLFNRPDYDGLRSALQNYVNSVDNIQRIDIGDNGIYSVIIDDSAWNASSVTDKAAYCKAVNTALTQFSYEFNIITDNTPALVYYYNQNEVLIAEPQTMSLESEILY